MSYGYLPIISKASKNWRRKARECPVTREWSIHFTGSPFLQKDEEGPWKVRPQLETENLGRKWM